MSEIRAESPVRHGARDGMTVHASRGLKNSAAFLCSAGSHGGLFFLLYPVVKLFARIDVHAQEHLGVLRAAVLGALAEIKPGVVGIDPNVVDPVWNQIRFSCKAW